MKKVLTFIIALAFTFGVSAQNYDVIEPELQRVLNQKSNDKISINIVLDTQADNEQLLVKYEGINDKSLKRENVIKELKAFATDNQNKLMSLLQDEAGNDKVVDIKAHWLVNSINCSASRDVIYKLSEQPGISVIGLNDKVKLLSDERPTRVSQSKSIIDNVTTVGADNVWDAGYTGKDVIVAVLDSGVNSEHVDLADHLWDGGNEYPDHGWNFIDNNSNTNDYNGHGTHCAGTICGDGTSGTQTGMAPDATLMCVKVLDDEGYGTLEALVSGVEFAVEHGADIMSISLGWTFPTTYVSVIMREMFENVLATGVVAAVAAGNERDGIDTIPVPRNISAPGNCPPPWLHPDQQYNPGGLSAVVSVGAVNYSDDVAYFSSRGPVTWQGTEWDDYKYDFRYNDKINLEEGWLYYDNGIRTEGIGGPDYFQWGIMIPATALQQYEGSYMTKVAIYDLVADNPQLLIYYGGDYAPETLVYVQDCELSGSNSMVEIELDEALPIYDENIWVVMSTQNGTSYPAACCDNTGDPNGRWLSIDGTTWEDLLYYGLNNTWMLRAYVTDYNTMAVAELNTITDYEFPTSSKGTLSVSGLGTSRMTAASNEDYFGLIRPDICAPGVAIVSAAYDDNYGFYSFSGTSMATPCVAGVMALMLDKDPSLTPADICRILETTATKLESTKSNFTGSGRINADMAINEIENTGGNNPITQKYRNVLIEEFTGRLCGWCPDGHRMANEIAAANPGKVFPINIHAGGYSTTYYPNLNTTDGNAIMNGFNVAGFPSGNVNRNSNSAIGRFDWEGETNTQLSQLTEVNIAGNVAINSVTRQAEITVELDYLSNSNYSTNYLTIMMLQDSIFGSQSGADQFNPEQIVDGQYCHMHVLRDVITNTWGDAIAPTTAGTHLTKTYIYEIPEVIGNPNGVEVDLDNIYFLAFVTEKQDGTPTRPVLNVNKLEKVNETPDTAILAAPTNLRATIRQDVPDYDYKFEITVAWDAVEGAKGYDVFVNTEKEQNYHMGYTNGTEYVMFANQEITFEFYVVAFNDETESEPSEICTVNVVNNETPDTAILAAPTNLRATIRQDVPDYDYKFEITVAWDAVEGAKGYDVFVNTEKAQDFHMGYTNGTAYVMGSNQEITFEFYVVAFNDETESEPSEICTVNVVNDGSDTSSSLIFFYEGNEITNTVNDIFLERDINDALEIQFDIVVGNNTANDMNVVCEVEDLSNIGQSYICWGNCYMPGITEVVNTVYASSSAEFNGHAMFVDEEWNELPKGTVIPVRYTFYDESNPSEKYVFNVKFIYENDDTANYWTPDESLYANNMTIITTVEIDGEEQYNPNLELGAFCNGELRGSARLQYVDAPANRYECFLMVYGNSGDDITFRLYDHGTGLESDLKSNEVVDFEVNASIGDVVNPYSINFVSTVLHSRDLTSGWNWYSTYIINEGAEGLANLEDAVGTNGIQIKNQTKFVNQASGNWYGTLTSTAVEDMFMIQMSAAHTLNLEGYVVNPAEHPITLGTNWKWISYPLAAEISVEEAFASANPSNGDYVKSQKGFAQYYEGLGWSGTLQVMTPGMGYMYQNTAGYAKTLVYPMANAKSKAESEVEENLHWTANATKYPMNMTVIAVVEDAARDYEVAAFSNGECRGAARPVYIEALGQSMIFMTIYGDDNDNVSFRYYDVTTGEEVALNDEMTFEVNATHGDVMQPYVMTLSTMGIDEASAGFNIYPNPVQDKLYIEAEAEIEEVVVYDVYGRRQVTETPSHQGNLSVDVSDLNSGVYFVQIKTVEGNITKRFVKE